MNQKTNSRIESRDEVQAFIQNLKYALNNGASIQFQIKRRVDEHRDERYTNRYTVGALFPNENPLEVIREELLTLTEEEYIRTVKDTRFPRRSEMREFGRVYNGKDDVYIKVRVELLSVDGRATTFVMSFHFAEKAFEPGMFPYRKQVGGKS